MQWTQRTALTLALAVLGCPTMAHADVTAFLGLSPTPQNRAVRGIAGGMGLVVVAFEVELATMSEHTSDAVPGLRTGMANVLVQTPLEVSGIQVYGTAGAGLYREELGSVTETNGAVNLGGGIKARLAGPLRVRIDYRLFRLHGAPQSATYHRVYAGLNLRF